MKQEYNIEQDNPLLSATGIEFLVCRSQEKGYLVAKAHMHNAMELLIIQSGSFRIEADGRQLTAYAGDLVFFRPNTIHQIYSLENGCTEYLVIKVKSEMLLDFAGKDNGVMYVMQLSYRRDKIIWTKSETEKLGIQSIMQKLWKDHFTPPYAAELSAKANTVLLLTELLRNAQEYVLHADSVTLSALQQIYQAINVINSRYDENITAKDCALAVDMSYTYFSRRFKSITGKSFTQYLNEVRINHAEKELLLTEKNVTEVAYSSGFNDVSYFIAQYKKLRGKTPYKLKISK